MDNETADVLTGISEDITKICQALKKLDPTYDTSQVKTIMEWYMASYSTSIADASNLKAAMNTNSAYEGLCHPMLEVEGPQGLIRFHPFSSVFCVWKIDKIWEKKEKGEEKKKKHED